MSTESVGEVQGDTIALIGMELENAVRQELKLGTDFWILSDMVTLLKRLEYHGLGVMVSTDGAGGWVASAAKAGEVVQLLEFSQSNPAVALGRVALAAVRRWFL